MDAFIVFPARVTRISRYIVVRVPLQCPFERSGTDSLCLTWLVTGQTLVKYLFICVRFFCLLMFVFERDGLEHLRVNLRKCNTQRATE